MRYHCYTRGVCCLLLCLCVQSGFLAAQGVKTDIRRATKEYKKKDYNAAEVGFRRIIQRYGAVPYAQFGLGASLQARGLADEAMKQYTALAERPDMMPEQRAALLHNMGNVMMQKKSYDQAVNLYKNALLLNPTDEGTRYNYALAKKLLRQQQQQQNQSNQNKNNNQDQQPREQNPNPDGQGEAKPSEDKADRKNEKGKPAQENTMSRENAEQILDAYKQDEDKTRRRIEEMRKQQNRQNPKIKKQW